MYKTHKNIFVTSVCLMVVILSLNAAAAQSDTGQTAISETMFQNLTAGVVSPFLSALKTGDVAAIKQFIGPELYESRKTLLEENKGYPEFLRNYYDGASFEIQRAYQDSNRYVIFDVAIAFPGGIQGVTQLYLWNYPTNSPEINGQSGWRIVEVYHR